MLMGHKVKELNDNDSLQLFCLNAFSEKHPKNGFEELSESVIAYCKGNPLALKVLGAHLYSRSEESWKSELRKLQKIQDDKIHSVLKLSFDDLDCTEQDIFLDIACFLKGESKDEVTSLLEACGFFPTIGIEVLIDKSLINISNDGKIEMHDLIQEMGRNIVHQESSKEPGRRSRLWDPKEVYDVLKDNKGTEAIEGIILDVSKIEDLHLTANSFAEMTNIRFLKFYSQKWSDKCHIYLPKGLKSLSNKLRYLQWNGYYLESLPSTFCPKLLVKLSMPHSNLGKLWDGVQDLVNLKEINLDFSKHLIELPDLSMATNLDALSLRRCESLRQVHPSILSLHKLQFLDLEGCTEIESLQTDVHLDSLRYLSLKKCSSLKEFSVSSKELFALLLEGTAIKKLPSSIWQSENLNQIHLRGCDNLDNLGNKLTHDPGVGSLSCLILSECKQLNASNLCLILDGLQSLTKLYLDHCYNLRALPDSIGLLSSLEYLNLSGSNVEILSPNIKNLLMLKELRLDNCMELMSLPKLPPSLKMLAAYKCTQLINASNICLDGLWSLTWLELENCYNLQELPENIGLLSSLQILDLRGTKVEILSPNIKNLLMLEMLKLDNCKKLVSLPELPSSLRILRLSNCTQLNASNICFDGLQSLTSLNLNNCCNLGALPDNIGLLSPLEYLNLSGSNVEILPPNIKNLLMLKELWLDNCMKLVSLPKLPHSLQVLSALNCTSLEIDFSQLPVIEHNISFSLKHGIKECCQYVFLPGSQVPNSFSFCAKEASITIPHLPQSDLCGFIFCLILSQSLPNGKYKSVECSINIYSKSIGNKKIILDYQNLISDHMLFWYIDINEGGNNSLHRKIQNSEVCDPYSMSFEFSLEYKGGEWSRKGMIKRCGVHPAYATEHGCSSKQHDLKLEFKGSSKDFVEIEPNSSKDISELKPRAFGFGIEGSNHHNEDDETKKLQEGTHQIITTGMQNENSLHHNFIASKSSKVQEEGEKEDMESESEQNKSKKRKLKTLKANLALPTSSKTLKKRNKKIKTKESQPSHSEENEEAVYTIDQEESTPLIEPPLTNSAYPVPSHDQIKQEKLKEQATSSGSGSSLFHQLNISNKSLPKYSPMDLDECLQTLDENPFAILDMLSGDLSFSSDQSESIILKEQSEEPIEKLLENFRELVFTNPLMELLPKDLKFQDSISEYIKTFDTRHEELYVEQVRGLDHFIQFYNQVIDILKQRQNTDGELTQANLCDKLKDLKTKVVKFDEMVKSNYQRICEIEKRKNEIEDQIRKLRKEEENLQVEKSYLASTNSKKEKKKEEMINFAKSISVDAVKATKRVVDLEKAKHHLNDIYANFEKSFDQMRSNPPF